MKCARCNRQIRHAVHIAGMALGARCAQLVRGGSPVRVQRAKAIDARQADLFGAWP